MDRYSICDIDKTKIELFLNRYIMGDEKWITYNNNVWKRSWSKQGEIPQSMAKPDLTPRKVVLCVCKVGMEKNRIHYELLPPKRLILISTVNNWKDYAKQSRERDQNWSIRKMSSSVTTTPYPTHLWRSVKNWENLIGNLVLVNPPPDIALDYHLFRSL